MTDKVLAEIADDLPQSQDELLQVSGLGPRTATRYGTQILKLISSNQS